MGSWMFTFFVVLFRSQVKSFSDVWAGSYNTVARTDAGQIMVMGLNNYR